MVTTVKLLSVCAILALATPLAAQEPVRPWPDAVSYATAAANPIMAAVHAWRSGQRWCRLGQLAISAGVGNGATVVIKHVVTSPRPCAGCAPDGMPSGHTMNSAIGFSSSGPIGVVLVVTTGVLRYAANRHTRPQVVAGAGIGAGAELAGHLLRCEGTK